MYKKCHTYVHACVCMSIYIYTQVYIHTLKKTLLQISIQKRRIFSVRYLTVI